MRPALLAGLALFVTPVPGLTQSVPVFAVVTDPEVRLRAGPSDQFPETATLRKGATLVVDHEEPNGWLAVQDPPGALYSLSWVQAAFVDFDNTRPIPQNVIVADDTTLAAGQIGLAQPLTHVRRAKVPAGTILTVIGKKVQFEGKWWHPVVPPAGDFRYLPRQAVRYEKAANTSFVVRDTTPPPSPDSGGVSSPLAAPTASASGPGTSTGKPAVQHPLWAQAEAAEREKKYDEAERLFFQLAALMNEPGGDHDIANLCYTRIHSLREKRRAGGTTSTNPPPQSNTARPLAGNPPPAVDARDDRPRWTGPGKLVRAGVVLDGRKTYALESNPGVTLVYVVGAPGVDLDRYVGRKVDVYGGSYTRQGLKKPYVVATTVELVQ